MDLPSTNAATSFGCGQEPVARRHARGDQRLDAAEQLLVLQLLVGEADQRFERRLVAERVAARMTSSIFAPMKRSTRPNMLA